MPLLQGTDRKVVWRVSQFERRKHPRLPAQALVEGRVLV
jgi:hypothetical protein